MLPESVAKELEIIRKRSADKDLKAEDVLAHAEKHKDSPLRDYFTWDDSEAARLHRLQEARELIRCHVIIIPEAPKPVRAYISTPSDRHTTTGYRRTQDVLRDSVRRSEMIDEALCNAAHLRERYSYLPELAPFFDEQEKLIERYRVQLGAAAA